MARRCDLNLDKAVMSGHKVSHSNRKTKRKFLPNTQVFSLESEALGTSVRFCATPHTVRSIEYNNGIDNYLLKTTSSKLSAKALALKKRIQAAVHSKETQASA